MKKHFAAILSTALATFGESCLHSACLPAHEEVCEASDDPRNPENELIAFEETSPSSYQGTTTGPGPNGGYPGSPKGSYEIVNPPKQAR